METKYIRQDLSSTQRKMLFKKDQSRGVRTEFASSVTLNKIKLTTNQTLNSGKKESKVYKFPEKGKNENHFSHFYGSVEGVTRCLSCDVAGWNGWKEMCPQKEQRDLDFAKLATYNLDGMGGR